MLDSLSRRKLLKSISAATASYILSASAMAEVSSAEPEPPLHGNPGESKKAQRARWVALAQALRRDPVERRERPLALVRPITDSSKYLRWRMEQEDKGDALAEHLLRKGDHFILDFGGHRVGYFAFQLLGEGKSVDSPVRLKLTFGEVPGDVAEPLYPYRGQLSSAWLPEEIITVDFLPQHVRMSRRYAFRYVKVEVIDSSPNFGVRFCDVEAIGVSATKGEPQSLPANTPEWIRKVDMVSAHTLRDCMQTTFEDGPRRDQRLWLGDLRLQARASYVTYPNFDLVKRCLFLFAGLARESDGLLTACVFEKPEPLTTDTFLLDYSALFGSVLLDYLRASNDRKTARELFAVALRQIEVLFKYVDASDIFRTPADQWIFIDWNRQVDFTAGGQGLMIYAAERVCELAEMLGQEEAARPYRAQIARMRTAARKVFFDESRRVCVSGPNHQLSWASQAWMVLGGCLTREEAQAALRHGVLESKESIPPATPYLYHHVAEAMTVCGMRAEALGLIRQYWGGMADAGADTFWELYDPKDSTYSPYGDVHINSFCHAWSCTPAWFFRAEKLT